MDQHYIFIVIVDNQQVKKIEINTIYFKNKTINFTHNNNV